MTILNTKKLNLIVFILLLSTSKFTYANLFKYTALNDNNLTGSFVLDHNNRVFSDVDLFLGSFKIDNLSYIDPSSQQAEKNYYRYSIGGSGKGFEEIQSFSINTSILTVASHLDLVTLPWSFFGGLVVNTSFDCSPDPITFVCTTYEYKYTDPLPNSVATRVRNIIDGDVNVFYWLPPTNLQLASNFSVEAVPEPETYAMFLAGLSLLGFSSRRKQA